VVRDTAGRDGAGVQSAHKAGLEDFGAGDGADLGDAVRKETIARIESARAGVVVGDPQERRGITQGGLEQRLAGARAVVARQNVDTLLDPAKPMTLPSSRAIQIDASSS